MINNGNRALVRSAFADFRRAKVRTFLTSLGVMIGVLSVVMLIALGLGLKNYIEEQFESLGANLVMVMPGSGFSPEQGFGAGLVGGGAEFDEKDVVKLERIDEVDYVVPVFFKTIEVQAEGEQEYGYLQGVNEQAFKVMNLEPLEGEIFGKSEVQRRAKVVVLGNTMAKELFGDPEDGRGRKVEILDQRLRVIGVLKKKGDREMDNSAIMPYKTTFGSMNPDKTFWSIYLGIEDDELVNAAKVKTEKVLLDRYDEEDFSVSEQSEILETVNSIFSIINGVLVAIGSISLLVGGIGIMNIMYASVTERTKEIGIKRAIGATKEDVKKQFLMESVILSVLGGMLGLAMAGLIVFAVRFFFPAAINIWAVLVAFGVSTAIGVFFGVFPANRAANLSPIEAIRYE